MYSYFNNVNNRDFSLQSECMLLQCHCIPICSDTATALQRDCNGFAVTLQRRAMTLQPVTKLPHTRSGRT